MLKLILSLAMIVPLLSPSSAISADPTFYDYAFKDAVFKLDVSFTKSKLDSAGRELCISEGTGFAVDARHVVTAKHVYSFEPDCGDPIIVGKSFANAYQVILKPLDSNGDVGLLTTEQSLTEQYLLSNLSLDDAPCAVAVSPYDDSFNVSAIRFGIPAKTVEPQLFPIQIGSETGQFSGLVSMTPIEAKRGESGGPVIRDALVVGVTAASVSDANTIALMIRASEVMPLLAKHGVLNSSSADFCNPAFYARKMKQRFLKSIRAKTATIGSNYITGQVNFDKTTTDKRLQNLLTETARIAVQDSLNRVIPNDGVRVNTVILSSGEIRFEIFSNNVSSPLKPSVAILGPLENVLPNILELDTKAQINDVFEQEISRVPKPINSFDFQQNKGFDPQIISTNRFPEIGSPEAVFPNDSLPNWSRAIQSLDPKSKLEIEQRLDGIR